jgi:UDP-N-acetylglucosamine:LPS N-acetylglucosamine transferase
MESKMEKNREERRDVILYIHSEGGHKEEMRLLLNHLNSTCKKYSAFEKISICENNNTINEQQVNYSTLPIRDKYSMIKTYKNIFTHLYDVLKILLEIRRKYNVVMILSTGAGISILPILFFKFSKAQSIHFESDCRFTTKSLSGRVLYKIVDKFYVPHKSLQKLYKNSHYAGQL